MTQCNQILDHLQRYGAITTMEAYERYGITRLSGRIWDLRHRGYDIRSTTTAGENRHGKAVHFTTYRMKESAADA